MASVAYFRFHSDKVAKHLALCLGYINKWEMSLSNKHFSCHYIETIIVLKDYTLVCD